MEAGHSQSQIRQSTKASRHAMVGRLRTANQSEASFLAAQAWESLGRKVKRVVKRGKSWDDLQLKMDHPSSSSEQQCRSAYPEMRRVQSAGDFLVRTNYSCGAPPPRGILKTFGKIVEEGEDEEPVSDPLTEDSGSDTSPPLVRRTKSLDESELNIGAPEPVKVAVVVETATEEEDGLYF